MATKMQQYRGTSAEWASANPILAAGELGFDETTKILRIGDGVTHWNSLVSPYILSSLIDAKGDLVNGSATGTPARLPKGTTGQRLTVNSDGTLGWINPPDLSSLELQTHASTTYYGYEEANLVDSLLESASHASATYIPTATMVSQHALYTTPLDMNSTYVSKAAAAANYEGKWTCKIKSSPTSRTSTTTMAADPDLVFPVLAGGVYIFEMNIFITGPAAGDFKFGVPSGIASSWSAGVHGPSTAIAGGTAEDVVNHQTAGSGANEATTVIIGTADGAYTYVSVKGHLAVATAGNFGLWWAQNVSNATATQVLFGSSLKALRVA